MQATSWAPRTAPVGKCPMCGAQDGVEHFRAPDRRHGIRGQFTYRRCTICRTVFQDPRVVSEDLPRCYPAEYYTHAPFVAPLPPERQLSGPRDSIRRMIAAAVRNAPATIVARGIGGILAKSRWLRERAFYGVIDELIPRSPRSVRALDVGCGTGSLMLLLARVGWEVEGVEWDSRAAEVARRTTGRPVLDGDFRDLDFAASRYDLVVLSHVFEHLADPLRGLRRIAELLAPGGRAVLVYPNPGSLGARLFGGAWFPWDPPRHLVLPPGSTVAAEARALGFRCAGFRTTARSAPWNMANSRCYRANLGVDCAPPGGRDFLAAAVERSLVRFGVHVGEEVILQLATAEASAGVGET